MEKSLAGVSQGSILGLLFFKIFINIIFLFFQKCELSNYADDSTMYLSDRNVNNIMTSLNHAFAILPNCFYKNVLKLTPDKSFLMLFGVKNVLQTDLVSNTVTITKINKKKYWEQLSPQIMKDVFKLTKSTYNFHLSDSQNPRTKP